MTIKAESASHHTALLTSHFKKQLEFGLDRYGEKSTPMWMASLDVRTGAYPLNDTRPAEIGQRVYRKIDAPRGSTLYWDQPLAVAAHALSARTGDPSYAQAADAYVDYFLANCVASNGLFLWGNHYYYDAYLDQTVRFGGEPRPVDMASEQGELHETRPIPPAWELFWQRSPEAVERCIRQMAERHIYDQATGGFNRHADGEAGCAFLESGGILAETMCWLYGKTGDRALLEGALQVARFSYAHRGKSTGLIENNPTHTRWDKVISTTEAGHWAASLLRAHAATGEEAFAEMAEQVVAAYLRLGYERATGLYYGRLHIDTGEPVAGEKTTRYQPDYYSDPWEPLFPTHDYPMPLAESALTLYQLTGKSLFREGASRWAGVIARTLPARGGRGAYAEHYGRAIHFLVRAADVLQDPSCRELAERVAAEAVEKLYAHGMFRGHPGEDRYDAVDGVGYLALSLMYLDTGEEPDGMGGGF
ncbi:hypothetical protein [Paenibacillus sp. 1P07SE]|uniref:hypothetical protein n=1 Tax=Paenibacillus sp. 1P07SE TaxID=3132209 RepID=UPI0039A46343